MAGNKTVSLRIIWGGLPALLLVLGLVLMPGTALAQSAKPAASVAGQASGAATAASPTAAASPGQGASASASAAQAPGAPQPSQAAAPAGVATPVGANAPAQTEEPVSILAYLLIALAAVWFIGAIAGIFRILTRPTRGPYVQPLPPSEADRTFLSFMMPFIALLTVIVILVAFGSLFLWLASISPKIFDTEAYPLVVDLCIIALVMFVASMLALRDGGHRAHEVH